MKVGPLSFGTHLSQNGGYHEDRRNKVIPYTYLNYGPFASFGPAFDSGASNCSPEANQLLLGTSWRPARLLFLNKQEEKETTEIEERNDVASPWNCFSVDNDPEMQAVLADCEAEWQEGCKQAKELDAVMPPAGCGDDFSLYLANALLKGLGDSNTTEEEQEKLQDSEEPKEEMTKLTSVDETQMPKIATTTNEQLLSDSAARVRQLFNAQYRRLGGSTVWTEVSLRASQEEMTTAHLLASQLTSLINRIPPSEVCSREAVRRCLDIAHLPLLTVPVVDVDEAKC